MISKNRQKGDFLLERVSGVEPPSYPWQGHIITTIRHPQL